MKSCKLLGVTECAAEGRFPNLPAGGYFFLVPTLCVGMQ